MAIDPELLKILACPESKKPLLYFPEKNGLFCRESRLFYPIKNGVPVLLIDEARRLSEQEAAALIA